jgi:hypothetical protein
MIIEGIVTKVDQDLTKKVYIEVRLSKVLVICFDGDSLIEDTQPFYIGESHRLGINYPYLLKNKDLLINVYKYNIVGFIRKHDVSIQNY